MNLRARFLFFTLLILVVLTQMLVLRWGSEATFFVTWLFLALTVQHDSRLSAAVGLAFLSLCPFLLIAKQEAVAGQAANYAYFLLAIGVLVQLEELAIERLGWLERKLDLFLPAPNRWIRVKPAWVLPLALALVVLPLAATAMVSLHNATGAERLARMDVTYNLVENLAQAQRTRPIPDGEIVEAQTWTIEEVSKPVLYQHPAFAGASRIAYPLQVGRRAVLAFDVAMAPGSWTRPGDGVTFAVYVVSRQGAQQVFSTYIDPKHNKADRRWHPYSIDLSAYAGQTVTLVFETGTGPAGDYRFDWAGWGEPRLLSP